MAAAANDLDFIAENCSRTPNEMIYRKQNGVKIFQNIINQSVNSNDEQLLLSIANWNIIVETIYQHFTLAKHKDKIDALNKLKKTALNAIKVTKRDDANKILALESKLHGFSEFFQGLGFEEGIIENRLVLIQPNTEIIKTAVRAIQNKIKLVSMYESLCVLWQICMNLMLKNTLYKHQSILSKLIRMDFLINYHQYYDILNKLLKISNYKMKIHSSHDLILQMMINLGFKINSKQIRDNDPIFNYMLQIYDTFKRIESFKQSMVLNVDENDIKTDDHEMPVPVYSLTLNEIQYRKIKGIGHFAKIVSNTSTEDKYMHLLNPVNWDIIIDSMCFNLDEQDDKIKKLKALNKIAQRSCINDKYRTINLDNKIAKKKILSVFGAMEFLKGVGFEHNILTNRLILQKGTESTVIIDVAVNCLLFKIKILNLLQPLQSTWKEMVRIMCKLPSFASATETVARLSSMDLYNFPDNYHDIATKVRQITEIKYVPTKLLNELGFKVNVTQRNKLIMQLFQIIVSIWKQVNVIEEEERNHKQQINAMVPSMERLTSLSPQMLQKSLPMFRRQETSPEIMENIFRFGRYYNDNNDELEAKQLISDLELAELYSCDNMEELEDELLSKVYEMQAINFQTEEYLGYIQHFKETKKQMKSRQCEDKKNCTWHKEMVELWSLNQMQLVHVMFYHTKDYNEIATSERRANRFRQEVNTYYERPRKKRVDAVQTKGEPYIADLEKKQSEPGATVCANGINCGLLTALLHKCYNVDDIHNNDSIAINDEYKQEIDHCLDCHGNFRSQCPFEENCKFQQKLKECHNNRFIQLHLHFYHNIAIDSDEDIIKMRPKMDNYNEERIQYKFGLECGDNKATFGMLEFGTPFIILKKSEARFKNPKDEILHNTYYSVKTNQWNALLRKCICFAKTRNGKTSRLNTKEIVALKLYTDFDLLQREFRRCFREKNMNNRRKRQSQFYFWNNLLETACKKSEDTISKKLYHGVNDKKLAASCFSGTYYGPVSTTIDFVIAKGFAGDNGQILELYPSFGAKGLSVSWLSNFPDENEVLYMNVSFQISDIFKVDSTVYSLEPTQREKDGMEQCILNALQTINIDSKIISLNENDNSPKTDDVSNFSNLANVEKLSVLYLLYLQYRPKEWNTLIAASDSNQKYLSNAFIKFRDQFISLAQNVKAVYMDNMSKLLQIFFYTKSTEYKLPILNIEQDFSAIYRKLEQTYTGDKAFYFAIIVKLFPCAEQIALNAANFDWSLKRFIDFLSVYDFEFHKIKLQDIVFRHITRPQAKKKLISNEARDNIYKLQKLGWIFVTPIHLRRVAFEPLPELPFLLRFIDYKKDAKRQSKPHFFKTFSQRMMLDSITPGEDEEDEKYGDEKAKSHFLYPQENDDEKKDKFVVVDHNPKNCILSKQTFDSLSYKNKVKEMLLWRKLNWNNVETENKLQHEFVNDCKKVESLVLNPVSLELLPIFYDELPSPKNRGRGRGVISFEAVIKIFPNVTDLFLRETTFRLKECYKFIHFSNAFRGKGKGQPLKLERIFFSQRHKIRDRDVNKVKLVLREIGWDFHVYQQMICKYQNE